MRSKKRGQCIKMLASAMSAIIIAGSVLMGNTVVAFAAAEAEPNNTAETATVLELNKECSGVISTGDDVDFYKFTTTQPGIISFDFSNESVSNNNSWEIKLIGIECGDMYTTSVRGSNLGTVSSPTYGVRPGTYYIKISGYFMVGVNYTVKANFTATNDWEAELNESTENAKEIVPGQNVNGTIYKGDDVDFYKFTIPEAGTISIDLSNESVSSNNSWEVKLIGTECGDMYTTSVKGSNLSTVSSPTYGVKAGTYYIKVSGYFMTNIKYTVKANFTATTEWEQEVNDSADKATTITSGKNVNGNIYTGNDVDYYRIDVSNSGNISLDFSNEYFDSNNVWDVILIDPAGNDIYKNTIKGKNLTTISSDTFNSVVGTYYVKVSGYFMTNKRYTIKVNTSDRYRDCEWEVRDGKSYWYENNSLQGTYEDNAGILGDGTIRGREIYDPASDGWYWLDSCYDGAKAEGKEVWIPYIYQDELINDESGKGRKANGISDEARIMELANESKTDEADMSSQVADAIRNKSGKWVRYDEHGVMLKGWVTISGDLANCYPDQAGNTYYYDRKTGLMAKGKTIINGTEYYFDETTGVLR